MGKAAVVLRGGSTYLTVGVMPEDAVHAIQHGEDRLEHLEVERVEAILQDVVAGDLEVGQTILLPLSVPVEPLETYQYPEEEVREHLMGHTFQELRSLAAERDLNPGANPSKEDLLEAFIQEQVRISPTSVDYRPVTYRLMEMHRNLSGEAADDAREKLDAQVSNLKTKAAVAAAYQAINDPSSKYETVQDVADKFDVHWRTVHRYREEMGVATISNAGP